MSDNQTVTGKSRCPLPGRHAPGVAWLHVFTFGVKPDGSARIPRFFARPISTILVLALAALGCGRQPYAATSGRPALVENPQWRAVLDDQSQAQVEDALASVASEHMVVHRPEPAVAGARWSDVMLAAVYACDVCEMAIVRRHVSADEYLFEIKTVEGHAGTLRVTRNPESVYNAQVTIGMFGDRNERADQLLEAFDEQMQAFGKKRQYQKD